MVEGREKRLRGVSARRDILTALTIAARGGKADIAKPFKGVGSGVFEIALNTVAMRFERSMRCRLAMTCR